MRLFFLASFIFLSHFLCAQSIDSLFLQAAIQKLNHAKEYTLKVAALMPDDRYSFRPSHDEMNFAEQLLHLSQNLGWLASSYLKHEQNPITKSDLKVHRKDSVIMIVNKTYAYAIDAMISFPSSQLKDHVTFFAGPMTKLQIINLINDHQTHHRAQLLVYLRMNRIKPPDYVGW
ncbi:MAG: DinB family protein [Bacteroidetes bacterium]|nr:DinB family protein [Bacteroidota bacterium]